MTSASVEPRFAVYLLPDDHGAELFGSLQQLLDERLGVRAAAKLPPHVTVKGFFRAQASVAELTTGLRRLQAALDELPEELPVSDIVVYDDAAVAVRIGCDAGVVDQRLRSLHDLTLGQFLPYVSEDCDFTGMEWLADRWDPHMTVASFDAAPHLPEISGAAEGLRHHEVRFDRLALISAWATNWATWWETVSLKLEHVLERQ